MDTSSSSGYLEDQSPGLWPPAESNDKEKTEEQSMARDWAELPRDALLLVLEKLDQVDILQRAELVCRPWQQAARDEPSLWRRIDIRYNSHLPGPYPRGHLRYMARAAVRRSAGQCEALGGEGVVHDWLISLLQDSARRLKSLRIISCENINDKRFSRDIWNFHMLEELEISNCDPGAFTMTCLEAADSCPRLQHLRLSSPRFYKANPCWDDHEVEGIASMRGLRSLQLFAQSIGTDGLGSILDNCTRLESLDIRHCFNVEMGDEMVARCSMFETLRLPYDSTEDYDLEFSAPDMDPYRYWVPPRVPPRSTGTYYDCYKWGNLYEFD